MLFRKPIKTKQADQEIFFHIVPATGFSISETFLIEYIMYGCGSFSLGFFAGMSFPIIAKSPAIPFFDKVVLLEEFLDSTRPPPRTET